MIGNGPFFEFFYISASRTSFEMSESKSIDKMLGIGDDFSDVAEDGNENLDSVVNPNDNGRDVEFMMGILRSMQMSMANIESKVNRIETEHSAMRRDWIKNKVRPSAGVPDMDALKISDSPSFRQKESSTVIKRNMDEESFTNVSAARSEASAPVANVFYDSYALNSQGSVSVFTNSPGVVKGRSGISNMGYNTKGDVWGVALASVLIGCMRKYIMNTYETGHMIREPTVAATYTTICSLLYDKVKSADVPPVHSPTTRFLAKMLIRAPKSKEVPQSDAKTWADAKEHTDGEEAMGVLESMIIGAKLVPEVMQHPISQLIPQLHVPLIRVSSGTPFFAIPASARVSMSPSTWEVLCSLMKDSALKVWIGHRLRGENEVKTMDIMFSTMKESEIFSKTDMFKARNVIDGMYTVEDYNEDG